MIVWSQVAPLGMYDQKWYDNTGKKSDFNIFAKANYKVKQQTKHIWRSAIPNVINYTIEGTHDDLGTA